MLCFWVFADKYFLIYGFAREVTRVLRGKENTRVHLQIAINIVWNMAIKRMARLRGLKTCTLEENDDYIINIYDLIFLVKWSTIAGDDSDD
jgi:hypothetical protein